MQECRHSSVDLSAHTILLPWVRLPSTPPMLLSLQYLCYVCCVKRTKFIERGRVWPFLKKNTDVYLQVRPLCDIICMQTGKQHFAFARHHTQERLMPAPPFDITRLSVCVCYSLLYRTFESTLQLLETDILQSLMPFENLGPWIRYSRKY